MTGWHQVGPFVVYPLEITKGVRPSSRLAKLRTPDGPVTLPIRVWEKINFTERCWLWTGADSGDDDPWGKVWDGQRVVPAHRWIYEEAYDVRLPPEIEPDHLCKVRLCVRPSHLDPITKRENVMRSNAPGPLAVRTNHCKRGHEFTPENTRIRRSDGGRECRSCARMRNRAAKERARARKAAA